MHITHLREKTDQELNHLLRMVVDVEQMYTTMTREENPDTIKVYSYLFNVTIYTNNIMNNKLNHTCFRYSASVFSHLTPQWLKVHWVNHHLRKFQSARLLQTYYSINSHILAILNGELCLSLPNCFCIV